MSRVPPQTSGDSVPGANELEELEELGDDAIIAQQRGAHAPQPRAQVTEDARSVVIAEHPAAGSRPAGGESKRRERTEKTVVIRDRRQIEELRRELAQRKPRTRPKPPESKGVVLWVIVGLVAFATGGLVALFATRDEEAVAPTVPSVVSERPPVPAAPAETSEPPSVSIDELPIEGSKNK